MRRNKMKTARIPDGNFFRGGVSGIGEFGIALFSVDKLVLLEADNPFAL
jgi:hypothetical protein